jgi:hypothetical protein
MTSRRWKEPLPASSVDALGTGFWRWISIAPVSIASARRTPTFEHDHSVFPVRPDHDAGVIASVSSLPKRRFPVQVDTRQAHVSIEAG